jgi:hypothetical protein
MASPSIESVYQQAMNAYKQRLTTKELTKMEQYTKLGLDDLISYGKAIGVDLQNQKAIKFLGSLDRVRVHLKPSQGLLQGLCKLSPVAGDLIWGSVRFILDVS